MVLNLLHQEVHAFFHTAICMSNYSLSYVKKAKLINKVKHSTRIKKWAYKTKEKEQREREVEGKTAGVEAVS